MFGLFKTKNRKCPDGTTKMYYRNVEDAFPFSIKGLKSKVGGEVKTPGTISGGFNAEYEEKIQGLLVKLDDLNNSLMIKFRAAYIVYQGDPCSSYSFLQREVTSIMRQHDINQSIRVKIDGLVLLTKSSGSGAAGAAQRTEFLAFYRSILEQIGEPAAKEAISLAINESREKAKEWTGGGHAG